MVSVPVVSGDAVGRGARNGRRPAKSRLTSPGSSPGDAAWTSVPSRAWRACWPGFGDPVPAHPDFCAGASVQLCARSRVLPRLSGDRGEGRQGTVVTRSRLCVWGAVVCGVPGPSFVPAEGLFPPERYTCLASKV